MKNHTTRTMCIVFCVCAVSALFFACAQTARQAEKSTPGPIMDRYEDIAIGFSIEYDAERLTKDPGPIGPFVFRRQSAKGMPSVGITVGPYPPGTALEDTADLVSSSLPRMIPGCIVHQVNHQQIFRLMDNNRANYFELDWNIGGNELIAAFVTAQKNDHLIVFGAALNWINLMGLKPDFTNFKAGIRAPVIRSGGLWNL